MSSKRITEVARETSSTIRERMNGYHEELVRCLIQVIQAQQEGLSEKGRRDRVSKVIEGLGTKVAATGRNG
jgi:hypothetical protein